MTLRDSLIGETYWEKWISFEAQTIEEDVHLVLQPSSNPAYEPQYVRDLAFMHIKQILRRYSRGDASAELAQYFEPFLYYWEQSESLGKAVWTPEETRIRHTWAINLDFYIDCFWLVGLALTLEIPDSQWVRLIALIGNEAEDVLLDRIIATRTADRRVGASLCYPRPYGRLLEAIDAPEHMQSVLLKEFVEHWYKEIGMAAAKGRKKQAVPFERPYWHHYHFPMEGAYFGYWCIEAAAAVKAFALNDNLCVGHPHYPGDLLRPGIVTEPDISRVLPELAATIGVPSPPLFFQEPRRLTPWEAFKRALKNSLRH